MDSNIHLFPRLMSGDIVLPLPMKEDGANLTAGHGLKRISGREPEVLQPATPKCSGVMCLCPDLRKWIFPAHILKLIPGSPS